MTLHDPTATGAAAGTTSSSVLRGSACASAAGGLAAYRVLSALPRLAGCVLGLLVGGAVFAGLALVLRCLPPDDAGGSPRWRASAGTGRSRARDPRAVAEGALTVRRGPAPQVRDDEALIRRDVYIARP